MPTSIEANALKVLTILFESDKGDDVSFDGSMLKDATQLSLRNLNDAVEYLSSKGLLKRNDYMSTSLYNFGEVTLNTQGRQFYYQTKEKIKAPVKPRATK